MRNKLMIFACLALLILLVGSAKALDIDREERINFGHVMRVRQIFTEPESIAPGKNGLLHMEIQNIADFDLYDVRIKLDLPSGISFYEDISTIKIAKLVSGETNNLRYQIIISPASAEGVYDASYSINYINNLGDEREDVDNFTIIVKSTPKIFAKIEDSEIYQGSYIGDVTFKFINDGVADIKFLTIELQESEDYEIISSSRDYVGDLDSDDFESVSFRVKVLDEKKDYILFPLKLTYKDALNNDYESVLDTKLTMRSAAELGKGNGSSYTGIIIVLILVIGAYIWYQRNKRKRETHHKIAH